MTITTEQLTAAGWKQNDDGSWSAPESDLEPCRSALNAAYKAGGRSYRAMRALTPLDQSDKEHICFGLAFAANMPVTDKMVAEAMKVYHQYKGHYPNRTVTRLALEAALKAVQP